MGNLPVNDLGNFVKEPDFEELVAQLGGMLDAARYRNYYRIARDRSTGSIIELGAGQGAGTVAFALGVRDSGRDARVVAVDQLYQVSMGPHPASVREHGEDAVRINLAAFRQNLGRYGVEALVDLRLGKTVDVDLDANVEGPFGVLAIDVDGMLDRDMNRFYDLLEPGGWIIIDDCRNAVNAHGRRNLETYRAMPPQEIGDRLRSLSEFDRRRILGKHVLCERLVEKFRKRGLLKIEWRSGSTLFCRKCSRRKYANLFRKSDADAVEKSIVRDFRRLLNSGRNELTVRRSFWNAMKKLWAH